MRTALPWNVLLDQKALTEELLRMAESLLEKSLRVEKSPLLENGCPTWI